MRNKLLYVTHNVFWKERLNLFRKFRFHSPYLKNSLKTDPTLINQTTIRMELYNYQMEISNEFNPMHGIIMLAGSQLFLLVMFCFASNVNDKKHEALQQKYYALKYEYETLEAKNEQDIDDYNELVEKYNTLLDEHSELEEKNETDITDYNDLVDKYNALVDESETRISRLESRISRNLKHKP